MSEVSAADMDRINSALFAGRLIEAVKLYRAATGCDLKTAMDFVRQLEAQLRVQSPERFTAPPRGVWGVRIALLLFVIFIGGIVAVVALFGTWDKPWPGKRVNFRHEAPVDVPWQFLA